MGEYDIVAEKQGEKINLQVLASDTHLIVFSQVYDLILCCASCNSSNLGLLKKIQQGMAKELEVSLKEISTNFK